MQHRASTAGQSWWSRAGFPAVHLGRLLSAPVRIVAVTIAVLLFAAACGGGDPAALQSIPGTSLQQLIADRNDPAVVMIGNFYTATVSVPTLGVNDAAVQALVNQVVAEAQAGQIGSDQKSIDDAFVAAIDANPGAYFTAEQPLITNNVTVGGTCTGSIVTPDGYIVTAAHCTYTAPSELQQDFIDQGVTPIVTQVVQQFTSGLSGFSSDQDKTLADAVTKYLTSQAQFSNLSDALEVAMFSNTSSGDRQVDAKPLSLVTQGKAPSDSNQASFGDKDVSIVKLDGYSNLPTLPVGSDTSIDTGEPLFIDGYPGAANTQQNLQDASTPTVTAGSLSAKKTSDVGVPLLETTGTISPGNSGGPGFDQSGDMVGSVSYSQSADNGVSYGFLIGGSVIEEFLHEKNIQPRQSSTTTIYDTALNDYYHHYYKQALPEFQQVKGLDPSHPYVDGFIQKTQTAITQGQDQTPLLSANEILILIVAGVALVALAGGGVAFFLIRRRRSPQTTPPAGFGASAPSQPSSTTAPAWQSQTAVPSAQAPAYQPPTPAATLQPPAYQPPTPAATMQPPAYQPQAPATGPQPPAYQPPPATTPPAPAPQPQAPATGLQPPAFQQPPPSAPRAPSIGFTAPAPPPTVDSGSRPEWTGPGGAASPGMPPFAPPPGWAWDGSQFIATGSSSEDPAAR